MNESMKNCKKAKWEENNEINWERKWRNNLKNKLMKMQGIEWEKLREASEKKMRDKIKEENIKKNKWGKKWDWQ